MKYFNKSFLFVLIVLSATIFTECYFSGATFAQTSGITSIPLRGVVEDTRNQLFSAQQEIMKLQELNYDLKKQLTVKRSEIESLIEYKLSLEEKLKLAQDNTSQNIALQEKDAIIQSLNKKISLQEVEKQAASIKAISEINSLIELKDNQINKLEKEIIAYKANIDNLSFNLVNIKTELQKTKKDIYTLNEEKNKMDYWKDKAEKLEQQLVYQEPKVVTPENLVISDKAMQIMMENNALVPVCYYNLGKAYQNNNNFSKAIENYSSAIKSDPNYSKAYSAMGLTYAEIGDYTNAIKYLKEYLNFVRNAQERILVNNFIKKLETNIN